MHVAQFQLDDDQVDPEEGDVKRNRNKQRPRKQKL